MPPTRENKTKHTRIRGKVVKAWSVSAAPNSVDLFRRTEIPKHRALPLVITKTGVRSLNNIDIDVYLSRKEFKTGKSKSFNNVAEFLKDLND